jgi:HlyD family secretion protein
MQMTAGRVGLALGALAAAAGIAWFVMPQPISVETTAVTKGRFVAGVDDDGKTRIRQRYVVAAPLAGRLTRVRLKAGDRLPPTMSWLRSRAAAPCSIRAAVARPRNGWYCRGRAGAQQGDRRARAGPGRPGQDRSRPYRTLASSGASTVQALERAELAQRIADRDLRAAEFQDHAAGHEVAQAKALLGRYGDGVNAPTEPWNVTAPVSGVVLKVLQESETVVQSGTPLMEIGDPRDLEIVTDVLSTDAVEIRPGAEVAIEHWAGLHAFDGCAGSSPRRSLQGATLGVEEQRVNVLIDVLSPPQQWAGLGDGFQVDTRITVFTQDDIEIIPAGALFRRGDNWSVYVADNGRAQPRTIELVRRSRGFAAVRKGLAQGERVIVYPSDQVSPGVRVSLK